MFGFCCALLFINSDEHFKCCQGSEFIVEDPIFGEKFLKQMFSGENLPPDPYPVTNSVCL